MPNKEIGPIKLRTLAFAFMAVSDSITELRIDDYIAKNKSKTFNWETDTYDFGTEVTSKDFLEQLDAVSTPEVLVIINSGGGDVTEGSVIANAIRRKRGEGLVINCRIDGLCASAAVDIACACERVSIYQNAYMMIHEARASYWITDRSATELRADAEMLDTMNDGVAQNYADKCGKSKEEVLKLMAQTKWFNGSQAVEYGLADEILSAEGDPQVSKLAQQRLVLLNGAAVAAADFSKAPAALQAALKNKSKTEGGGTPQEGDHEMAEIKSVAELKTAYPELCGQMETGAAEAAVKTERERLSALDKVADKVPADMLAEAKYGEKPCDAKAVVYRAVTEGKLVNQTLLSQLGTDAKPAGEVQASANGGTGEGKQTTAEQKKTAAAALAEKASKAR